MKGHCTEANQGCKCPSGARTGSGGIVFLPKGYVAECYVCGGEVCVSEGCSKKVLASNKRRRRMCVSCIDEKENV